MNTEIANTFIGIVGNLCSVASLLFSLLNAKRKDEVSAASGNKPLRWPFMLILSVLLVSFVWLIVGYIWYPSILGWGVMVTFIVSVVVLVVYACKAYASFDKHYILWPQKLWRALFNKIPSHIENGNQLVFKVLVLKMEESSEVVKAAEKINDYYKNREHDFQVEVKSYRQDGQVDVDSSYCGVIFIVGKDCWTCQSEVEDVMDQYSRRLALPIAYIVMGEHDYHFEKYHCIGDKYLETNCLNHLIMRSYRRSEHWIRTSKYGHIALLSVACLALILLIAFIETQRNVVVQRRAIAEKNEVLKRDTLLLARFGYPRSEIHLANEYVKLLEVGFDIEALQHDAVFKDFVDGFGPYVFGEFKVHHKILIWLRNDLSKKLVCIYDSETAGVEDNKPKGDSSIIGGIARHAPLFVLWPGYNNHDTTIWNDPEQNIMAWTNEDDGAYVVSKLIKDWDGCNNVALQLQETNTSQPFTLEWKLKNRSMNSSNAIALYGYSYDGRLAVELDFSPTDLNANKPMRIYIQNLLFRNCVRKFSACITSFLNCYAPRIEEVEEKE